MKVRVGLGLATTTTSDFAETFWQIVDACEAGGWDSIWFSERLVSGAPDPVAAMAAVAGRTKRLKFGPSVLVLPGRHPVLLAKELATIDVLSGGRLIAAFGLGVDRAATRRALDLESKEAAARTDEATELIRRLWTEDQVTHTGRFFRVEGLTLRPRPAQVPHPDIWFGGISPPALRRVGRLGDGWLPSFIMPSEYKEAAESIRDAADAAGRMIDSEHFGALVPYLPDDAAEADAVLAAIAARRPGVDPRDVVAVGGPEVLRARLEEFIAQGASKFVVTPIVAPPDWPEELARVRDRVAIPIET